jgi:hypothetical protein
MVGVPAEAQTTERTISQREAPLAGSALSADISADGRKDLVIASVDYERVVWHLNEIGTSGADDDGYGRAQEILSGANDIQQIGLADINGSGGADLVLFLEDGVAWRENQTGDSSTEAFGERKVITDRTADPFRNGFQLSDLSGDGRADLVLLDENSGTLYWFKNEVNTSEADTDGFGKANKVGSLNTSDQEVFVSDLNADGSEDILVDGTWFENQIGTSSADSDGFAPGEDLFGPFSSPRISLVGDLDGDGDADLVDTDGRWQRNEYVESGKVNFISEGAITSESFQTLSLEDADGDGDPDIFLKDYSDHLIWRENQIGESGADDDGFGPAKAIGTQTDATILTETINGDDRADLVASSREAGVEWYPSEVGDSEADSDGFGPANPIQTPGPLHDVQDAQVADLDGDGDLDIVSASAGNDQIAWHPNQIGESGADSDGFGSLKKLTTSADSVVSLATGDVDSDGDPDVFAAYGSPSKVVWIENQIGESGVDGDGFGPVQEITTDIKSAHDITVGDLDSDGDPDVISGAAESETIAWHENQVGEGSSDGGGFSSKKVISTGDVDEAFGSSNQTPNIRVVSADFDEDGKPDVAGFVASGSRMEVAWHENQIGTSTADSDGFGPAEVSETGSYSFTYQDLVAKDIDLDGSVDLATTRGWYENRTQDAFPSTEFYGISYDRSLPGQISKALAATDWDADGDPDIALLGYRGKLISLENQAVDPDPFGETSARRAQDIAEGFADALDVGGAI